MLFEKKSKQDKEIYKCFQPIRKNFDHSSKSARKQLAKIMNNVVAFYKVYDGKFIGCLFVDQINEKEKNILWGGFAHRRVNTRLAIKEFMAFLEYHYPDYKIQAKTKHKTAKISLAWAGFNLVSKQGGNTYEWR